MLLLRDFKPFQYDIYRFTQVKRSLHPCGTIVSQGWNDRSTGVKKYKFNVKDQMW